MQHDKDGEGHLPHPPEEATFSIYRFGQFELDEARYELRRAGARVHVQSKPLAVLFALAAHRHRTLRKDELRSLVWQDVVVTDATVAWAVKLARRALGDLGGRSGIIQTVWGVGYRFSAEVDERRQPATPDREFRGLPPSESWQPRVFVGRRDLMEKMHAAVACAHEGSGRMVLLTGVPGIGKTRTMHEFAKTLRTEGFAVGWASGRDESDTPPFWLWIQVFRDLVGSWSTRQFRDVVGDRDCQLMDVAPSLRAKLGQLHGKSRSSREQCRSRVADSIGYFASRAAHRKTLVFLLDDLHEADADSLRTLASLAPVVKHHRICIVGTARDALIESISPLGEALCQFRKNDCLDVSKLGGFSQEETFRFIELTAGLTLTDEFSERIFARTQGNPSCLSKMADVLR